MVFYDHSLTTCMCLIMCDIQASLAAWCRWYSVQKWLKVWPVCYTWYL